MENYDEFYQKSMQALESYIQENKAIPTEKVWNRLAGKKGYFTSHSLGYLANEKFPDLCKKIYKQMQRKEKEN